MSAINFDGMKKLFLDTLHGPQVSIMSRSSHVLLIILGIGGWIGFFSLLTGQSENVIKPASKISTYENAPHRTFNTRCFDEKRVPDYCYSNVDGVFNQDVSQDDGLVLNYIRHCHLDTPSDKMIKLSHPLRQTSQAKAVDGILQGKVSVKKVSDRAGLARGTGCRKLTAPPLGCTSSENDRYMWREGLKPYPLLERKFEEI